MNIQLSAETVAQDAVKPILQPQRRHKGLFDLRTLSRHIAETDLQSRIGLANGFSFLVCSVPFVLLLVRGILDALGPNPAATLTNETGLWALRLLWVTLCVTPLRKLTGYHWLIRLRRIPALFCFFYASLHVLTYLLFEQEFDPYGIWRDLRMLPYLSIGFVAYLCLVPLAATSTDSMMRRLGGKNWKRLHKLTYLAAIMTAAHYLLLVKRDITDPAMYIIMLAILFAARMTDKPTRQKPR